MPQKYTKPILFDNNEWAKITNIVANPNGELARREANSYNFPDEISNAVAKIKKDYPPYPNITETALLLFGFPLLKNKHLLLNNIMIGKDVIDRASLHPMLDKYQDILLDNYNKLPRKSQSFGIKEAVNALTPIPAGNANIVNQRPLTIGIPQ